LAELGFKWGYDKTDLWQGRFLEKWNRKFGTMSRGMHVGEQSEMQQYQLI
jgi:hypothetical protein